jgi:hypothetical protein
LGKFLRLDEDGRATFTEGQLSILKFALEYAAEIFSMNISGGAVECPPTKTERLEQESPIWIRVQGENVSCQVLGLDGEKPLDVPLDMDAKVAKKALSDKFISLRLYREGGQYMLDVFSGGSQQSVARQRRRKLVKDMVAWVNKTGDIDRLFDLIESDPATAGEIIKHSQGSGQTPPRDGT